MSNCPDCNGDGLRDRIATPDEVDNGCELGLFFYPCETCHGLADVLASIGRDACPVCGRTLGKDWTTVYDEPTGRQKRLHIRCAE